MNPSDTGVRRGRHRPMGRLTGITPGILLLALLAISQCAVAKVYRWVDAQGNVHFGDRPPTAETAEEVRVKPSPKGGPSAPDNSNEARQKRQQKLLDMYQDERAAKREAAKQAAQEAREREQNCARARDRLRRFLSASGIYQPLPDGKRRYYSKEEREAATSQARESVARWCDD